MLPALLQEKPVQTIRLTVEIKSDNSEKETVYWLAKGIGPVKIDVKKDGDVVEHKFYDFTDTEERISQERALQEFLAE